MIDIRATTHATSQHDLFSTYTMGNYGSVKMGNDAMTQIAGISDICLETSLGTRLVLKDVKHVPDIRMNLISTGDLMMRVISVCMVVVKKLSRGSLIVVRGKKSSSFHWMHAKVSKDDVNAVENDGAMELWHKRLGQMSEKGMSILSKNEVIPGISGLHMQKCSHCFAEKQHKASFKSSAPSRKPEVNTTQRSRREYDVPKNKPGR